MMSKVLPLLSKLIITSSVDATSDLVLSKYKELYGDTTDIFRFNFDLFNAYKVMVTPEGFQIEDPTGRLIKSENISSFYWRKPFSMNLSSEEGLNKYNSSFRKELLYDIVSLLKKKNTSYLVDPFKERELRKVTQMSLASNYFKIPNWYIGNSPSNFDFSKKDIVSKGYIQHQISKDLYPSTKSLECPVSELSSTDTWFLQEKNESDCDVTVVYVKNSLFAFEFDRSVLTAGVDWRVEEISAQLWKPIELSKENIIKVHELMSEFDLYYGRLDFMRNSNDDELFFLEVNTNGQFAWLDIYDKSGLISKITNESLGEVLR